MIAIDEGRTMLVPRFLRAATSPARAMARCVMGWTFALALGLAFALASAPWQAAQAEEGGIEGGTYRAVLQSPGGELPFGLELARDGYGWAGYLVNGKERLKLPDVVILGPKLAIKMPGYENELTATAVGDRLHGELVLKKRGGKDEHMDFSAQRAQSYRFFPGHPNAAGRVSGRWSATFTEDNGNTEPAVGEFSQSEDHVSGTFLSETGDHRFLDGQVRGDELFLSTFDGAHAFLYKAKIDRDGTLSGDFWSGASHHERWTARRDPGAKLADAYSFTSMRGTTRTFDFEFPDLMGQVVKSTDPKFRNKVLIVALAGSWCPNCHDEAAFLAPIYRDYRSRGLEIVSLMFEYSGDLDRASAAVDRFRRNCGIEYTTLIAGVSDKDEAAKKLPMLQRVYAFPTMIFIDRQGHVRKIHTGFSGPATGAHYTEFAAEFKKLLEQLLTET